MQATIPLQNGNYYHIYNRGINGTNLFNKPDNFLHFLRLYDKYIDPIAETYAWCLMPNHFHLLVRIKEEKEIWYLKSEPLSGHKATDRVNSGDTLSAVANPDSGLIKWLPKPEKQFSHLFNAYAQAFNKQFNRHGGLFETPFHRIPISHEKYFRNLVFYIHNNPVHHGFVKDMVDYPWSSFLSIISLKPTKLAREKVTGWFDSKGYFIDFHKQKHDLEGINHLVIE